MSLLALRADLTAHQTEAEGWPREVTVAVEDLLRLIAYHCADRCHP